VRPPALWAPFQPVLAKRLYGRLKAS
jgi:hypothetical protein